MPTTCTPHDMQATLISDVDQALLSRSDDVCRGRDVCRESRGASCRLCLFFLRIGSFGFLVEIWLVGEEWDRVMVCDADSLVGWRNEGR